MMTVIEELVRVILARIMMHLLGVARGQVTAQAADGTVTVQCAWGQITNVPISMTWPDCTVTGVTGCHVLLAWPISTSGTLPAGPGELPCVVAFLSGTFTKVQIGGTRPIARTNDTVDCGTLTVTTVASGVFVGTYTPAGGIPGAVALGVPIAISGKISTGSDKIEVG